MKFLKISSISLTALFLFSSCSQPPKDEPAKKDSIDVTKATTDIDATGATTDNVPPWREMPNYRASISQISDSPTEYNGEELCVTMEIENKGDAFEQGFFLYVNGERNDYSTDEHSEEKPYHVYSLAENGITEVTLHFTPYNRKKGEKAIVCITSMITPDYTLDTSYISFGLHHRTVCLIPFVISINQDAPENEYGKISTDCIKTEMTIEYEKKHHYIKSQSGNEIVSRLDTANYFKLYQEEDALEGYYIAEKELALNIDACGVGGRFLVGIYINNELQKAFGDNYYALCEIDREHLTKITASIDVSKLSKNNHIYMVAAPYDPAELEKREAPHKTDSLPLFIGDRTEIETEIEEFQEKIQEDLEANRD